eukprot:CAMPEP_0172915348 /NCGR_PEP_ID=MMETSP1075-20121228/194152_1 /TAXON_ID=2916 /ORGANISM="Ceratium fusus, Strain PA161109" /LENGTH=121 /DNA_ID=CAMNT_0013774419 /DNA_START=99 /DNA_END=461 /DNA_ORIENTATION=+
MAGGVRLFPATGPDNAVATGGVAMISAQILLNSSWSFSFGGCVAGATAGFVGRLTNSAHRASKSSSSAGGSSATSWHSRVNSSSSEANIKSSMALLAFNALSGTTCGINGVAACVLVCISF